MLNRNGSVTATFRDIIHRSVRRCPGSCNPLSNLKHPFAHGRMDRLMFCCVKCDGAVATSGRGRICMVCHGFELTRVL